jgi:hypothetical protein
MKVACDHVRWVNEWRIFVPCRYELGHGYWHRDLYGYTGDPWIPREMVKGEFVDRGPESRGEGA